jgi:glycosyltransferase involved in cell wall biosynthesis
MACNLPIVTTDVGDVRWLLEVVNNTAIVRNSELEIASAIKQVLKHSAQSMLEIGYWS